MRLFFTPVVTAFLLLWTVAGCRKAPAVSPSPALSETNTELQPGLPPDDLPFHGLLFAKYLWYREAGGINNRQIDKIALFRDPPGNLLNTINILQSHIYLHGNINVGDVIFNGTELKQLQSDDAVWYDSRDKWMPGTAPDSARWRIEGNKSFKSADLSISRGFPVYKDSAIVLRKSQALVLPLKPYFSNFDSVRVRLRQVPTYPASSWRLADYSSDKVEFDSADVTTVNPDKHYRLQIVLVNYSHITIGNKTYVFILTYEMEKPISVES